MGISCVCSTVLLSDKIPFWAKQGKSPGQAQVRYSPDRKADIRDWTMSASTTHAAAGWLVKKESDPISCEAHKWHLIWKDLSTTIYSCTSTAPGPASYDKKSFWNTKSDTYHAFLLFPFEERDVETSIHFVMHYTKQLWWRLLLHQHFMYFLPFSIYFWQYGIWSYLSDIYPFKWFKQCSTLLNLFFLPHKYKIWHMHRLQDRTNINIQKGSHETLERFPYLYICS